MRRTASGHGKGRVSGEGIRLQKKVLYFAAYLLGHDVRVLANFASVALRILRRRCLMSSEPKLARLQPDGNGLKHQNGKRSF